MFPCGTLSRLLMINFREFIRFTKSLLLPHKYIGLSHPTLAPGPKRPTVSDLCQDILAKCSSAGKWDIFHRMCCGRILSFQEGVLISSVLSGEDGERGASFA